MGPVAREPEFGSIGSDQLGHATASMMSRFLTLTDILGEEHISQDK